MATDFTLNRDELINAAFRTLGIYASGSGETPTSQEITDAAVTLNLIIKALYADGLQLWALRNVSVPLVADQVSYTVGTSQDIDIPRPTKLADIVFRNSSGSTQFDRPLDVLSRERYMALSNKLSKGEPVSAYYEPRLNAGILYIWPVPNTVTDRTLEINYIKLFENADTATAALDFPPEFINTLKWLLAEELSHDYGIPLERQKRIQFKAGIEKERIMSFDQEDASVFITPEYRWRK